MRILSKTIKIVAALLSIASGIRAAESTSTPPLESVAEVERSFARTASERGIRNSFLQFFADDSIIFAPVPTNGKAFYEKYEDKGRRLIWQPIFATVSNSGELGLTTGPWEMKRSATDETSIAFGEFVSLWKKQGDNSWKVILDVGIDHPKPIGASPELQLSPPIEVANTDLNRRRDALEQTEKGFTDAVKRNAGQAISDFATDQIRIFRDESFPAVGKEAAKGILDSDQSRMNRKTSGGGVSASNDLAYRYGSYSGEGDNDGVRGHFLTIWKIDRSGDWKIILDLQKKAPNPDEK